MRLFQNTLFILIIVATFSTKIGAKDMLVEDESSNKNNNIAIGYSFDKERPYGWCFMILRQGIGLYVDSHSNAGGHSIDDNDYYASLTIEESEKWNTFIKKETHKVQYTIGLTYPLVNWLYAYASVGRSIKQEYYNYYDKSSTYFYKDYWLGGSRQEKTIEQAGVILYHSPIFIKVGASFKPVEYKVGIGFGYKL